ncbi:PREDICTED: disintegrin and metalloproteinase domain-containing protein 29-like [Hipposideros armiger]|uniref:Disintegrin and metalloproteinase domain-containing protein 29-like n=1 Tax=Hipposideros armiger TaxID=186990 RepID=A0A8B7QP61_HIPAR|nr:PREDICTED: disintegrin and metalloproteinase domain-containing protein 29-like [Hipposideros armiger]
MTGWLSYSLRFGGQRHVIRMWHKKLFWPRHLLLMTQDDQGTLQMDYPFVPLDCYYVGYLEGVPLSTVTMDTCDGGLEGIMKLDDLAYEIKPLKDSQRYYISVMVIFHEGDPASMSSYDVPGAQHIGRTIGLHYDADTCVCQRRTTCIMHRYPVLTDVFSNCSFSYLQNVFTMDHAPSCLFMTDIVYTNRTLAVAQCGDDVVDEGEQCDCGSFKHCYSNPCCNSDCSLTPGSACDVDRCCTNCTYSPPGTLCRPIQNVCDLPEYCLGSTSTCPENVYLQDGTPCTEEGYCYHGNCTDRTMHCREIFGEGVVQGPDVCYAINKKGHRFGHCRKVAVAFNPDACREEDIKCGRLQCTNVTHLPRLQEHVGFHQSLISGVLCFGVDLHRGTETTDVGHVRTGTPCGFGKFCLNTYCNGTMAAIVYDCEPSKCNRRGVCNNQNNCHCHVGWKPPECIQKGAGGSVNSGPPPRRMRSVSQNIELVVYFRVVVGRLYAIIAGVLLGVATNVRTIKSTTVAAGTVGAKQ